MFLLYHNFLKKEIAFSKKVCFFSLFFAPFSGICKFFSHGRTAGSRARTPAVKNARRGKKGSAAECLSHSAALRILGAKR
jgi:hypothetical protein